MTDFDKFDIDLRYGEAREDALIHELLQSRVEVKSDRKCRRTGNLAIEYEQTLADGTKQRSGIALDNGVHRWAFEFDDDCWLIVPKERVAALARRAIREKRHRWIGDNDDHHCALVPIQWFTETTDAQELEEAA